MPVGQPVCCVAFAPYTSDCQLICITMGWVILAMQKIIVLTFNLPDTGTSKVLVVLACMLIAGIYCALSGFWGVVITDLSPIRYGNGWIDSASSYRRYQDRWYRHPKNQAVGDAWGRSFDPALRPRFWCRRDGDIDLRRLPRYSVVGGKRSGWRRLYRSTDVCSEGRTEYAACHAMV